MKKNKLFLYVLAAIGLFILPLLAQQIGNGPVRIIDLALL
ncbi:MAG: ABC transporter ATP-binding protein, partial [Burkholderiaceae bacterium]|nr:ABC transporter ATP-binding protein [Burkholderiaceae bacterium]